MSDSILPQTNLTLPHYNGEQACTDAGGVATTDTTTNTVTCDLTPAIKRPSWLVFGLSVAGALAVGAGAMHLAMKGNHR